MREPETSPPGERAPVRRSRRSRPARPVAPASRRLRTLQRSQQRVRTGDRPEPAAPVPGPPRPGARSRRPGLRRLWASLVHPGRGQVIAAVILFVVGMGGVVQIRLNAADDTYTSARREDLVSLLDGLGSESRRLESELAELQRTQAELRSGADSQRVAREEAQRRAGELAILAGTAPAEGPGIRLRITDPAGKVGADLLLDAVEEMRDAGAEVIEINDTVRVVGSTWFGTGAPGLGGSGLVVDGVPVARPITFDVIGDPHSLEEAARFRGGLVSEITSPDVGGQVQVDQQDRVLVSSLHASRENQYAQPAPAATPR